MIYANSADPDRSALEGEVSLIRIYIVCHSTIYFKKQLPTKQNLGQKNIKYSVPNFRTFSVNDLGPVVQSIISLTSLLVVKMLIVPISTISNSQVFLLKKKM